MYQRHIVFYLNILLLLFCSITFIQATCIVRYPVDADIRPTLYKYVGFHKIKINPNRYFNNFIKLSKNQKIEAHCDIAFEAPSQQTNHLYISCDGYLYTKTINDSSYSNYYYSSEITLRCSNLKWNLYESSQNFPWCPFNVASYIVARPKVSYSSTFDYLATICYDVYSLSFKSVYYTLTPGFTKFAEPSVQFDFYKPSLEIKYLAETFGTNSITQEDFTNQQFRNWINISNYKFSSIIQHSEINSKLSEELNSILEFVWWSNLLAYNWNYYKLALEYHVEKENQIYDILAGVSGTIKVPYFEDCQTNFTMKEIIDDKNRKIPMYVWNYLQARDNNTNDLVIIGFNSPFNEFYSEKDIIFCPDICQKIPWLKKISSNFRYSLMGIIFCCNVEDVKSSKRLNGFPEIDIKTIPSSSVLYENENKMKDEDKNETLDDALEEEEED